MCFSKDHPHDLTKLFIELSRAAHMCTLHERSVDKRRIRRRIPRRSPHGRALLPITPSSARTSAPSKQEQERYGDGKDRPCYHTPGHPGGRRLRPWSRCCCLPLQQILQRAIHTSDKPLGRPRHQGRYRLVINTAHLIFHRVRESGTALDGLTSETNNTATE